MSLPPDLAEQIADDDEITEFLRRAGLSVAEVIGVLNHHLWGLTRGKRPRTRPPELMLTIAPRPNQVLLPRVGYIDLIPHGGRGKATTLRLIQGCDPQPAEAFCPSPDNMLNLATSLASFTRLLAMSRKATPKQIEKIVGRLDKGLNDALDDLDALPSWRRRRRQNAAFRLLYFFQGARDDLTQETCLHIAGRICEIAGIEKARRGDAVERIRRRLHPGKKLARK